MNNNKKFGMEKDNCNQNQISINISLKMLLLGQFNLSIGYYLSSWRTEYTSLWLLKRRPLSFLTSFYTQINAHGSNLPRHFLAQIEVSQQLSTLDTLDKSTLYIIMPFCTGCTPGISWVTNFLELSFVQHICLNMQPVHLNRENP